MTPLERSRGLGTRLATLLPTEGETGHPSEGQGRGVRAIIPVKEGADGSGLEGPGPSPTSHREPDAAEHERDLVTEERSPHVRAHEGSGKRRSRPTRLRRDQRIFVGLEILQSLLPVELCAYVEQGGSRRPRVYMRAAGGALSSADEALEISSSLEALIESCQSGPSIAVGDLVCLVVRSGGSGRKGMHVLGRRGEALCKRDRLIAERFCRLLRPPARPPR